MIHNSIIIIHFAITAFIISISTSPLQANTVGFTIDLIHRDFLQSTIHDPSWFPSQHLLSSLRRSFDRALRFKPNEVPQSPSSDITGTNGEYIMKYSIGTPPVPSLGIADTGSDLIWMQCPRCVQCFKQKQPLFEPNKSSTYKTIPCNSTLCHTFSQTSCDTNSKTCSYSESYGDKSFTDGDLATDVITLGSTSGQTVSIPITFGCGHRNGGVYSAGESGIVGLGGGNASLISQLGPSIERKFSYCLISYLSHGSMSSKLHFGTNGEVVGEGVVSTPLVFKKPETYYYLTLLGLSVGNETLTLDSHDPLSDSYNSTLDQEGNIIIDSGTTLTLLPPSLYTKLENAVSSKIKLDRVLDPEGILNLCYFTKTDILVPHITVHFKGADVKLKSDNSFVRTSNYSVCLAFSSAVDVPVYGNLAQMNFLVGYDLVKNTVSFKPTDCTKS